MADKPIMVAVDVIRENPWNPNEVPADTMAALKRNIDRFGFNQPILVRPLNDPSTDAKFEVVDGAHRFRAAVELGLKQIPVVLREFTDAEAKAQTIAMNKLRGEMDPAQMARLVREIDAEGIDGVESLTEFIGMTADELDALDAHLSDAANTDPVGEPPAGDQSSQVNDSYFLVVTCKGEQEQLALVEKLEADGYECRVVVS